MDGTVLEQVHRFNCLESLIASDGRCVDEIKSRMAQAKASFHNMKSILTNKRMSLGVRKRVLQCYIEPILLYGCESWSLTRQTLTSIEAMEMWFLRRMLRVSFTEKITNLDILNTARSTRKFISNIKRRQAALLGHVIRKGKLDHSLTTGNIEGKRSRGRQRIKIQDGIAAWLGRSTAETFVDARDREKWKVMIAYACNRHGIWERRGSVVVSTSAWHAAGWWFDSRARHVSLLGVKTWLSTGIVYLAHWKSRFKRDMVTITK